MSCLYLSHRQIESLADNLNRRYDPSRLKTPKPADVYDIIDLLGAGTAIDYLTPDRTYLGITLFQTENIYVWPGNPFTKGMRPKQRTYSDGTIIIDRDLAESKIERDNFIENFTVVHECFHFAQHRYYFTQNNNISISYRSYKLQQIDKNTDLYFIEHQANYAASVFLMPREAVISAARELLRYNGRTLPLTAVLKQKLRQMGRLFGVNYGPMSYRLQELKIIFDNRNAPRSR